MPELSFPLVTDDNVLTASAWLLGEVERLEAAGVREIEIHYPSRFADELEIAVVGDASRYRGHPAFVWDDVPYQLTIEHKG